MTKPLSEQVKELEERNRVFEMRVERQAARIRDLESRPQLKPLPQDVEQMAETFSAALEGCRWGPASDHPILRGQPGYTWSKWADLPEDAKAQLRRGFAAILSRQPLPAPVPTVDDVVQAINRQRQKRGLIALEKFTPYFEIVNAACAELGLPHRPSPAKWATCGQEIKKDGQHGA